MNCYCLLQGERGLINKLSNTEGTANAENNILVVVRVLLYCIVKYFCKKFGAFISVYLKIRCTLIKFFDRIF